MKSEDLQQLLAETKTVLAGDPLATFAVIGMTSTAIDVLAWFRTIQAESRCLGIFTPDCNLDAKACKPLSELAKAAPTAVILADDEMKEDLLESVLPFISVKTRILLGGFGHFAFRDPIYDEITRNP